MHRIRGSRELPLLTQAPGAGPRLAQSHHLGDCPLTLADRRLKAIAEVISFTARETVRMIYHINRFAIKKDAPQEQLSHALDLLHRLGKELEVVEFYSVGRDLGGEFEVGALYALKDIGAYRTYMFAPIHEEIDNAGLPIVASQVSYDLADDPDPQLGEKIAQVHRDRFAQRPELRRLVTSLGSYQGPGTEDLASRPAGTGGQPGVN